MESETILTPPSPTDSAEPLEAELQQPWTCTKENILTAPYDYLDGQPGKNLRSQLMLAFNTFLDVPPNKFAVVTKVVTMLHTASLLVDDIEDASELRRGAPVAHSIYGAAHTLNSANYIYFKALSELLGFESRKIMDVCIEELVNLHRGQGMDLYWRETLSCPTESEYVDMVNNKTAGLFRMAVRMMQAESTFIVDCVPLLNTIGVLFQITDDYLNYTRYATKKGFCEDLSEGKFSFPVIAAIHAAPSNPLLISILRQKPRDDGLKRCALRYMEEVGAFKYTQRRIEELRVRCLILVSEMEQNLHQDGHRKCDAVRLILESYFIT